MPESDHQYKSELSVDPRVIYAISSNDHYVQQNGYDYLPRSLSFRQMEYLSADVARVHRGNQKAQINTLSFLALRSLTQEVTPPELGFESVVTDLATAYNSVNLLNPNRGRRWKRAHREVSKQVDEQIRRETALGLGKLANFLAKQQ